MLRKLNLLIVFMVLLVYCNFAQQVDLHFERISIENGLSQSSVNGFVQDSLGFVWIGTWDGLNKYDGYKFTVFKPDNRNPNSISGSQIFDLKLDKFGRLWIATEDGLDRYDYERECFVRYRHSDSDTNSLVSNMVFTLCPSKDGTIWVGTDRGLENFDPKTQIFKHVKKKNPTTNSPLIVTTIVEDRQYKLWFGTDESGFWCYDIVSKQFKNWMPNSLDSTSLSHYILLSLLDDNRGNIWIGTREGGLNRFNKITEKFEHYKHRKGQNSVAGDIIESVVLDKDGKLWIGTNAGMNKFNPITKKFVLYKYSTDNINSISSDAISSIYQDNNGMIWVGTKGAGLCKFDQRKTKFLLYRNQSNDSLSLSHNQITALVKGKKGVYWVGTRSGLNKFNRHTNQFHVLRGEKDPKYSNFVRALLYEDNGNLWLGSDKGIEIIDTKTGKSEYIVSDKTNTNSLSNNYIVSLFKDMSGDVWAGTWNGLNRLVKKDKYKTIIRYQYNPTDVSCISDNVVFCMIQDKDSTLWFGTRSGGLNKLIRKYDNNGKTIEKFLHYFHSPTDSNSISSNKIRSLYIDSSGIFWVGTSAGITKWDRKTNLFLNFNENSGLPNNVIYGILEDKKQNLWLSTNKGLCRFNKNSYDVKTFGLKEGLQGYLYSMGACVKGDNNEFFFGGYNGLNVFNPDSITDLSTSTPLMFTELQIFNNSIQIGEAIEKSIILKRSIHLTNEIHLSYSERSFALEFAALEYQSPEKIQYAYMLDRFDKTWNYTTSDHRFVSYSNLMGGTYLLRIKSTNSDGVWLNNEKTMLIVVHPPFWRTWWFWTFVIFIIVGVSATLLYFRFRVISEQRNKLELEVHKRTSELENANLQLKEHFNEIQQQQEEIIQQKETVEFQNHEILKQAEILARTNQQMEKLSLVASKTDNAIIIADAQGNFEWINDSFTKIFGLKLNELINNVSPNILGPNSSDDMKNKVAEAISTKQSVQYEFETHLNGQKIWMQATLTPIINQDGIIEKLIIVDSDITKVKQAEYEIIKQKTEIEKYYENLRLLSEFGQRITSSLNFEDVVNMVYFYVKSLMDATVFAIGVYNSKKEIIEIPVFQESDEPIPSYALSLHDTSSLTVYCLKNKVEIISNNLQLDHKKYIEKLRIRTRNTCNSAIYIPLYIENRPIGVITVQSHKLDAYNQTNLNNLRSLGSYISIALDNSNIYKVIHTQNENIRGSIKYAETIQKAILPNLDTIQPLLDCFVIFRPKDIVSGDFYWFTPVITETHAHLFFALVDCTGHGVPGAFMSMIASSLLNEIVREREIYSPAKIINLLNEKVTRVLKQHENDNDDGMDLALCRIDRTDDPDNVKVTFCGAKNHLIYFRNFTGELTTIKGDRRSVGGIRHRKAISEFTQQELALSKGDMIYMFTDGIIDQNNRDRRRYGSLQLEDLFLKNNQLPLPEQKLLIENSLGVFMGDEEQRDDVSLVGIRI